MGEGDRRRVVSDVMNQRRLAMWGMCKRVLNVNVDRLSEWLDARSGHGGEHGKLAISEQVDGQRKENLERVFLGDECKAFREESGFEAMSRLVKRAVGDGMKLVMFVTGYRGSVSSAHKVRQSVRVGRIVGARCVILGGGWWQDDMDGVMLLAAGRKKWAVGKLPEELVGRLPKRTPMKNGLFFDAFDPDRCVWRGRQVGERARLMVCVICVHRNEDEAGREAAELMEVVEQRAGDIIFVPGSYYHAVESVPYSLGYSFLDVR